MYKVISANRAPKKTNKNWRIFEKEMMEKHFGKVLNVNGEDRYRMPALHVNDQCLCLMRIFHAKVGWQMSCPY